MQTRSANYVGTGAAVTVASIFGVSAPSATNPGAMFAKWLQITTPSGNAAVVRVGGPEVSSTVGYRIPTGWAGQFLPPISEISSFYHLERVYIYVAVGDQVDFLVGVD